MVYLVSFVIMIILFFENNKLKKEIKKLKDGQLNYMNFCPNCGHNLKEEVTESYTIHEETNTEIEHVPEEINTKPKEIISNPSYSSQEFKNSLILITGAILIVVAAISFLVSTWYTSANYLKTFILVVMFLVFWGSSIIAEKYLKINQTSKVFYFISLSYIPIIFLSIGLFGLLGDYLSFSGEGRYTYLLFSCLLISFIYYLTMKKKNSIFLCILSIIFEMLSVTFFILIFTNKISVILIGLVLYSHIFNLLYIYEIDYFKRNVHELMTTVLTCSLCFASFALCLNYNVQSSEMFSVLLHIIALLNLFIYIVKIKNKETLFNVIYPILAYLISIEFATYLDLGFICTQICVIVTSIIIYFVDSIRYKKILPYGYYISCAAYFALYVITLLNSETAITSYLLIVIFLIYSFINYLFVTDMKKQMYYIIGTALCGLFMDFVYSNDISILVLPVIYTILVLVVNYSITEEDSTRKGLIIIGNIFLNLNMFISLLDNNENMYLLSLIDFIPCIMYYILSINNKKYKYYVYIYINIVLCSLCNAFNLDGFMAYALPIGLIINVLLELYVYNKENKDVNAFLIIEYLFSSIYLLSLDNYIMLALFAASTMIYLLSIKNKDTHLLYIPFSTTALLLYFNTNLIVNELNIMYFLSVVLILALVYFSSRNDKLDNIFLMSVISIGLHLMNLTTNRYLGISLLIVISLLYYYTKRKNIFKILLYIFLTFLFEFIIYDLSLESVTLLSVGPYMILLVLITRTVLSKTTTSYKMFEYLGSSFINFVAMLNYTSQDDGMIYLLLLLAFIIIGYSFKMGPILLTSLIFILLNVFMLTKEFWISLPWWIYLLVIGAILIVFAMRNEISNKKTNNLIDNIKSKLDL